MAFTAMTASSRREIFFSCALDCRMTGPRRSSREVTFRLSLDVFTAFSLEEGGRGGVRERARPHRLEEIF